MRKKLSQQIWACPKCKKANHADSQICVKCHSPIPTKLFSLLGDCYALLKDLEGIAERLSAEWAEGPTPLTDLKIGNLSRVVRRTHASIKTSTGKW